MKIIEDEGFCTSCGRHLDFNYGEENFSLITKDFKNYNNYKDIYVYSCPNCNFVSTNISSEEGVLYSGVKDTEEYVSVIEYSYLNGLDKELYDNHSENNPANLYEAYSLICLAQKDLEKYVRTLNKCADLKEILARSYKLSQHELGGEEENDDQYEELNILILNSIEENRKHIVAMYNHIDIKNVFLSLIIVENLAKLKRLYEARDLYTKLAKKYTLSADLKKYFKEILMEGEDD